MSNTKEYNHRYYAAHRDVLRAYKKAYYRTHQLDYARRYKEFIARRKAKQGKLRKATRPAAKALQA